MRRVFIAYLVIPNLVFNIMGYFIYSPRGLVNLDYLFLAFIAPLLNRPLNIALFIMWIGIDLLGIIAPVYHFSSADMLLSFQYAFSLNGENTYLVAALILCAVIMIAIICVVIASQNRRIFRLRAASPIILAGLLLFSADILSGANGIKLSTQIAPSVNLATSAIYKTSMQIYQNLSYSTDKAIFTKLKPQEFSTSPLFAQQFDSEKQQHFENENIVVVVVESLGISTSDAITDQFQSPFVVNNVKSRYIIENGTVPYTGNTVMGEMRELCGLKGDSIGSIIREPLPTCLPSHLRDKGYQTIAMHGFTRHFFHRYKWYPLVGFNMMYFAEDIVRLGSYEKCGSTYRGICDGDMVKYLREQLLQTAPQEKKFIYWLTLNSHLPVSSDSAEGSLFDCEVDSATSKFEDVCRLFKIQHKVFSAIAELSMDPDIPPTKFIIVGDHAPPFLSNEKRNLFVDRKVPFLVLSPLAEKRKYATQETHHD